MAADDADRDLDERHLDEVAAILRRGPSDVADERPDAALWDRIRSAIEAEQAGPGDAAPVVSLERHRSRRAELTALVVGVAAALLLVVLPLGLAYRTSRSDDLDRRAELAVLDDGTEASGRAELDGRELRVDIEGLMAAEGEFYELWLLDLEDGELQDLVSLGPIDDAGTFTVTDDVDLDRFSVVDVSIEPDDGDPAHSGASVLRGELAAPAADGAG